MWEKIFFDSDGIFMWSSIAAIIALVGSASSALFSWLGYTSSKKTAEFQRRMEQKKIDANLKAKARIEWINEVRHKSSDLISLLLSLQKKEIDYHEQWLKIEEASELLKLYFSYNDTENVSHDISFGDDGIEFSERAESIIENNDDNKGKNKYLRRCIDVLVDNFRDDSYRNILGNKRKLLRAQNDSLYQLDDLTDYVPTEEIVFDDGFRAPNYDAIPKKGCEADYNEIDGKIKIISINLKKVDKKLEGYHKAINQFSIIISLYLKIEWDKAKNGE
ncbi:MAG: hypothetical protein Q6A81_05015 [Enterococcus casseliflavus]|nr:hypothetical protein [Enterococcus casseliflavus]